MKCYVVEDLLPEYIEDLCREETVAEIEAHLETCEHCQEMFASMREETTLKEITDAVGAEDIQPFKKVKKKMKRERIKKIVAIVALVAVCGFFGMLTVSQFFPSLPIPSYDSLMYRYKGWKIAKQFVEGDMRSILGGTTRNLYVGYFAEKGDVFDHSVTSLLELHKSIFQDKEIKIDILGVTYEGAEYTYTPKIFEGELGYYVNISLTVEGESIPMLIYFDSRNSYSLSIFPENADYYGGSSVPAETYSDSRKVKLIKMNLIFRFFRHLSEKDPEAQFLTCDRISALRKDFIPDDFNSYFDYAFYLTEDCSELAPCIDSKLLTAYQAQLVTELSILAPRLESNRFTLSNGDYNRQEKKYNATLYWTITDLEGKSCVMTKAFYYGPMGYETVDNTEKIYADDGFDKEILKNLEKIFDKP